MHRVRLNRYPLEQLADARLWNNLVHIVYTFCAVFNSAAVFIGKSHNLKLLKAPEHTNLLIGVLLKFRNFLVAFMVNIKVMFMRCRVLHKARNA